MAKTKTAKKVDKVQLLENRIAQNKKALIEALIKSLGIVSAACDSLKIGRSTFYKYYREDVEFKLAVEDVQEIALDFVETKLFSKIKGGDTTAIIFYLKTKGKARGYIERTENINLDVIEVQVPSEEIPEDIPYTIED
jgi:hypothetical protein